MLTRYVLAAVAAFGLASSAMAQDVPTSADECFGMSGSLLEQAGEVPADKEAKIEQLVKELESNCDAGKFAEAAASAKQVKSLLGLN